MFLTTNHNLLATMTTRSLSRHYAGLESSVRKLSSGVRLESAGDDAAGLAIREMMRADIRALHQGIRNANDAVSMIQVAEGALQSIDVMLIRMKELAVEASTGTYTQIQRQIINSEYMAMCSEIQRIVIDTEFNGIKILSGNFLHSKKNIHEEFTPIASIHVHFGPENDKKEDFYDVTIESPSLGNLGLAKESTSIGHNIQSFDKIFAYDLWTSLSSGIRPVGFIPKGSENIRISLNSKTQDDDLQIFTRSGQHLLGTNFSDHTWVSNGVISSNAQHTFLREEYGFYSDAVYDDTNLLDGRNLSYDPASPAHTMTIPGLGMNIGYSGDGDINNDGEVRPFQVMEHASLDIATEDLLIFSVGTGKFEAKMTWAKIGEGTLKHSLDAATPYAISTQASAQEMLETIDSALVRKEGIRASLGAMQNRLENTITNLQLQAENLQNAESRISDTDMAQEFTAFVRQQILTQTATALISQANALPKMALKLLQSS